MFGIICKSIHSFGRRTSEPQILSILRLQEFSSSATNANKSISKYVNEDSVAVRYLMNEFGFSLEKAVLASKDMQFESRDKPDVVVSFFRNQGFTESQIQKVISGYSRILACKPEKTLLPKIEFLRSKGVSSTDLAKMIAFNVQLLRRSLKQTILPSFKFLGDVTGSDERVIHMLKRNSMLLTRTENHVKPNIEILRGAGVPYSKIVFLLKNRPGLFIHCSDTLKVSIEKVQNLGLDPRSSSYSIALSILATTRRAKWDEKKAAYKSWGCSEEEVIRSFKIMPWIMNLSVEKINEVMNFCVNEMSWKPSEVLRRYFILTMSLNNRIIPRWAVFQELVSKRLVEGKCNITTVFTLKEDLFVEKYVTRYKNEAPLLLKLYLEKLEASKR